MAKFKIGDRVRVRNDLKVGNIYWMEGNKKYNSFERSMSIFSGKEVTIADIRDDGEYFIEGDMCFYWTDEMFEGIMEEEKIMEDNINVCEISSDDLDVTVVDTEAYEMLKSAFDHISYLDDVIKEQEEVINDLSAKLSLYEE